MRSVIIAIVGIGLLLFLKLGGSEQLAERGGSASSISVPRTVVCVNPAATEMIYAMGREDLLVAVSDYCDYPAQAASKEKIGGVINPNLEKLAALSPDLIILQGKSEVLAKFCQLRGIEVLRLDLRNLKEILYGIQALGSRLGCSAAAEKLCGQVTADLDELRRVLAASEKKSVFLSLYRTPGSLSGMTTVGPGTFLSEVIEVAGGSNVFGDLRQDYSPVSKESLLKRQPDIIIEPCSPLPASAETLAKTLQDWSKLPSLRAVQRGQVFVIDADLLLRPGPRLARAARDLAKLIHPELFDD